MTPLAQRFARDLTVPIRDRVIAPDNAHILERMDGMHCFDVSHLWESVNTALDEQNMWPTIEGLLRDTFLPSERTWLEIPFTVSNKKKEPTGLSGHLAIMLEMVDGWLRLDVCMESRGGAENRDGAWSGPMGRARAASVLEVSEHRIIVDACEMEKYIGEWEDDPAEAARVCQESQGSFYRFLAIAVLMLDIINQPTLCHLKVHQPHRGLERALRKNAVGRYPLLAWHEVLIKPQDRPLTQEEVEGHLTGRKCLHFVRSHRRRYRDGNETLVVHHWRGDPALGIKRTRYRVEHGR